MNKIKNTIMPYAVLLSMAVLLAFNYHLFIVPNNFAPAGLNGIATMIQYKTGFSISYVSLIINTPLCVAVYFFVNKKYGLRSLVFTLIYSGLYLVVQKLGLEELKYDAGGHDTVFPVIISGVLSGIVCGLAFKYDFGSGGMEITSKIINSKKPGTNFFMVTFTLNAIVATVSLFVYSDKGYLDYKPVALCIMYCFISNFVGNYIIKGTKIAYKFTVITSKPDEIIDDITHIMRRGSTRIEGVGAYSGNERTVIICVVDKHQLNDFRKIIDNHPETFAFSETVTETYGNFKKLKKL